MAVTDVDALIFLYAGCPLNTQLEQPQNKLSKLHSNSAYASQQVLDYIEHGWTELTRSTNDCASLTDTKVVSHPVLYLPSGYAVPPEVTNMAEHCYVQILSLPRPIRHVGDVKPEGLPAPGLLYLPHPYVVPGGRFNEMYGWDSYFIVLGLLSSGLHERAKQIVDNLLFEIEYYGTLLNANRTYYLTRSQPPFLAPMILAVFHDARCFADFDSASYWLAAAYKLADKYYRTWTQPDHMAGDTGLARYFDLDVGPVPELADDTKYFHHVIEWLLDHPEQDPGYLIKPSMQDHADIRKPKSGCNPRTGVAHQSASIEGYRLTPDFYLGDRAMRESGFDTSFRFGPFCGSTHQYAPVCLNSLLVRYELDMAEMAGHLELSNEISQWKQRAEERTAAIQHYLWRDDKKLFMDYNFIEGKPSSYSYLSAYYALWTGIATHSQAAAMREQLPVFERSGGLAMSASATGMQWDEPFGWAPTNWIVVKGLYDHGFKIDAMRIAESFVATVNSSFASDATVREKYNMERGDANVRVTAGYRENVIGFGWTNGVYLKMIELLNHGAR